MDAAIHLVVADIGIDGAAIHTFEAVFQGRCAEIKLLCQFFGGVISGQIVGQQLMYRLDLLSLAE